MNPDDPILGIAQKAASAHDESDDVVDAELLARAQQLIVRVTAVCASLELIRGKIFESMHCKHRAAVAIAGIYWCPTCGAVSGRISREWEIPASIGSILEPENEP